MDNAKTTGESRQFLSFLLDKELFAFEVLKVREVLEVTRITKVPKTPPFMIGVINLRGGVVPVVDLRLKFDLPQKETTVDTSIIIVEARYDDETLIIGALVDAVKAVIRLEDGDIEEAPRVGMRISGEFIAGIGKKGAAFVILLDSDRVFSRKEMDAVAQASAQDALKEA